MLLIQVTSLGITQTYYLTFTVSADVILTTWCGFVVVVVILFLRNQITSTVRI